MRGYSHCKHGVAPETCAFCRTVHQPPRGAVYDAKATAIRGAHLRFSTSTPEEKERTRSVLAGERKSRKLREAWAKLSTEQRRARNAPAVEAARKLAGTPQRAAINLQASKVAASAPPEERRRRGQKTAATRKLRGTDKACIEAARRGSLARWASMSPEERSAVNRASALKRWARVQAQFDTPPVNPSS